MSFELVLIRIQAVCWL